MALSRFKETLPQTGVIAVLTMLSADHEAEQRQRFSRSTAQIAEGRTDSSEIRRSHLRQERPTHHVFWLAFLVCFLITPEGLHRKLPSAFGCRIEDRLL